VLAAIVLRTGPALAQSGTSTIAGIVRDTTGASIAAARVAIVDESTGVVRHTAANAEGLYRVGSLLASGVPLD